MSYTPRNQGPHKVRVLFDGNEIPNSPFTVNVEAQAGDPTKVTASGPGLQPEGVIVNKPTYFDIFTKGAGHGVPEVIVLDPQVKHSRYVKYLYRVNKRQGNRMYLKKWKFLVLVVLFFFFFFFCKGNSFMRIIQGNSFLLLNNIG